MADVFALDSNIYIRALRDPQRLAVLKRFLMRTGTRLRVHALVALELRAGVRVEEQAAGVEALIKPYADRDRVVVPSFEAYMQAGRVLGALTPRDRGATTYGSRSFVNDAIIASSCREADVVLVTENAQDFSTIKRHVRGFRFVDATALDTTV